MIKKCVFHKKCYCRYSRKALQEVWFIYIMCVRVNKLIILKEKSDKVIS